MAGIIFVVGVVLLVTACVLRIGADREAAWEAATRDSGTGV